MESQNSLDLLDQMSSEFDNAISEKEKTGEYKFQSEMEETEIENEVPEKKEENPTKRRAQERKTALEVVNPKLAITIFDVVISRVFSGISNMTSGFTGLKESTYKDFKLDSDEKKAIEPVLTEYLASLEIRIENKLVALLTVICIIYAGKVMNLMGENDKPKEKENVPRGTAGNESWKGDKRYFQTGAKAGQLKPSKNV